MTESLMLKPPEAADLLNVGRDKIYELVHAGELKAIRLGRSIRIPKEEIQRFIASKLQENGGGER